MGFFLLQHNLHLHPMKLPSRFLRFRRTCLRNGCSSPVVNCWNTSQCEFKNSRKQILNDSFSLGVSKSELNRILPRSSTLYPVKPFPIEYSKTTSVCTSTCLLVSEPPLALQRNKCSSCSRTKNEPRSIQVLTSTLWTVTPSGKVS